MPNANYKIGDIFQAQFVWRIPGGDYLRALFDVEVLKIDSLSDKYVVRLKEFTAGRQEKMDGTIRPIDEVDREYWAMVAELVGRRISLAFEADDTRPLWLRFETLTGEHNFFSRLDTIPTNFKKSLLWEKIKTRYSLQEEE